jgi:hypothetical protein
MRHNLTVGAGRAAPLFRSSNFWTTRPAIKAGYGYRFLTNLQADMDFMTTFSPGQDMFRAFRLLEGDIGGGALYSLSFGGRGILPLRQERFFLSLGAGAVCERYSGPQLKPDALGRRISLDESGWGAYALVSAGVALDRRHRFRLAVTPRMHIVNSQQAFLHRDRWLIVLGEFSVGF